MMKVYCKPTTTTAEDFQRRSAAKIGKSGDKKATGSLFIDDYLPVMRLGASDVPMYQKKGKEEKFQ